MRILLHYYLSILLLAKASALKAPEAVCGALAIAGVKFDSASTTAPPISEINRIGKKR